MEGWGGGVLGANIAGQRLGQLMVGSTDREERMRSEECASES
jgi:hypothetical protein